MRTKGNLDFFDGFLIGMIPWAFVGFILALFLARHIWVENAKYYDEVHYKYGWCPYCGEKLE